MSEMVAGQWRAGRALAVPLSLLDALAIDTLLQRVLGGLVDGRVVAELLNASGAHAPYLRELLLASLTNGSLEQVHGGWRLGPRPEPSAMLRQLVQERVSGLGRTVLELLGDVGIGEPVGLQTCLTSTALTRWRRPSAGLVVNEVAQRRRQASGHAR